MQRHNHHHIPQPGPFADGRRAHHQPFPGDPFAGDRRDPRDPFVGDPAEADRRRGYRDQFAGPGPRGGHGRFGGAASFDPGFGPEEAFGPGFGPGRHFGPGADFGPGRGRGGHRGGRRAGRGDIRAAILLLLAEQPRHGYELIREISERTDGAWQPSPGAIYPALSLLEDEGLVTIAAEGGRRLASLSEAGRAYVTAHADELGDPFAEANARAPRAGRALRDAARGLMGASMQVAQNGDEAQAARAQAILVRATKDIYLLLAGQDPADATPADDEPTPPAALHTAPAADDAPEA
jgi:DNA-binding PadR family transcriptional regulator